MKFIAFFCAVSILFFGALANSYAGEYQHAYIGQTTTQSVTNNYVQQGAALSDAFAQIDCNFSSVKWHGGVGVGINEESFAQAAGLCKRYKRTLIKATIGREDNKTRGGIGIMFQLE